MASDLVTSSSTIDIERSTNIESITSSSCNSESTSTAEHIHPQPLCSTNHPSSSLQNVTVTTEILSNPQSSKSANRETEAPVTEGDIRLGLVQPRKGFLWPEVVPLITLKGSLSGVLCNITVDGGATTNFVSSDFVIRNKLNMLQNFKQPFKVLLADNSCLSTSLGMQDAHLEFMSGGRAYKGKHQFMVLDGLVNDVVLGRPFLKQSRSTVCHSEDQIVWPAISGSNMSSDDEALSDDARPSIHTVVGSRIETDTEALTNDTRPTISKPVIDATVHGDTNTVTNDTPSITSKPITEPSINIVTSPDTSVHVETPQFSPSAQTNYEVGTPEQRTRLQSKLNAYDQRVENGRGKLPPSRGEYDHRIREKDPSLKPPKQPAIRLKPAHARVMKETLDKLLHEGKIRRSTSPYAAPAFIVDQGDKPRMVINYEKLNALTETNATSIPHVDELIARLSKARIFSKIDLTSGFHQLRMHEDDVSKTAFSTPFGHFEWLVMPFGEKNAPASFVQLLSQHVLVEIIHDFIIVFFDDILIFSPDEDQHIEHVEAVLQRLADHELYINPKKCTFMVSEVDFLGYRLRAGEDAVKLTIQENKTKAITDWPVPKTIGQLRSFLGTANFSRTFIQNFSTIARPLTEATSGKFASKNASILWDEPEQRAFEELKRALIQAPALAVPDEDKPFTLYTDASNFGIGTALCQWNDKLSAMQPCAYMSSKLTGAELNWTVHEKELYALVHALEHWSMYLSATRHPIKVFTDNIAMLYMLKSKKIPAKRSRWLSVLLRYNLDPQRIEGVNNVTADALSRRQAINHGQASCRHSV